MVGTVAWLKGLRLHRSLTQVELAEAIGMPQSAVSRLERQPDLLVSTLRRYVEATGGRLHLIAVFDEYEVEVKIGHHPTEVKP